MVKKKKAAKAKTAAKPAKKSKAKVSKKVVKKPVAKKVKGKAKAKPKAKSQVKAKVKVATRKKAKVSAIPKGYNTVTPYLVVSNATQAIEFYIKAFDAKVVTRLDKPDGKVAHAELNIGNSKIMLGDECPEMNAHSPKAYGGCAVGIHLYVKNVDITLDRAINAGATLSRPAQDMFYGDRIGSVEDPFGHKWSIATRIENVTAAQLKKRASELYHLNQ
jgi:PhnB protein